MTIESEITHRLNDLADWLASRREHHEYGLSRDRFYQLDLLRLEASRLAREIGADEKVLQLRPALRVVGGGDAA